MKTPFPFFSFRLDIFAIALIFFGLAALPLSAQEKRVITKNYEVSGSASLSIKNSFGDIKILPGSAGKVETSIIITLSAKGSGDKQMFFDAIQIDAKRTGNDIAFVTMNNMSKFRQVNSFSIDYVVTVPKGTAITIQNSFGDVAIEVAASKLTLDVEHGDLAVSDASGGNHHIDTKFGDLRVQSLDQSEIKVQHGDFKGGRMTNMVLSSQFGDVELASCGGDTRLDVRHGDLRIDAIATDLTNLDAKIQFGDVQIAELITKPVAIEARSNFGDISWKGTFQIEKMPASMNEEHFKLSSAGGQTKIPVKIYSQHGDITIR